MSVTVSVLQESSRTDLAVLFCPYKEMLTQIIMLKKLTEATIAPITTYSSVA